MNARKGQVLVPLALGLIALLGMLGALGTLGAGPPAVAAGNQRAITSTVTETLMALYNSTNGEN